MSRSAVFRPDIQGLRGIAILAVVAFHCGVPGFRGGFVGVDVFFVLSGYLITGLLIAEFQQTSRITLRTFYARRIRRLLPASALVLLATLLTGSIILAPSELTFTARAARASAVYMSNLFFTRNAADYFNPAAESNPMLHTWTLAVEEQFYLVWPVVIILGLRVYRSRKGLVALLTGLVALSLTASIWLTERNGVAAFYGLPTRAWEFGIGGLVALLPWDTFKSSERWIGWLGLLTIAVSIHAVNNSVDFPGWIALVPVIGTAAVLTAGAGKPRGGVGCLLAVPALQTIGELSYSWYLWHWPFLVFLAILAPHSSVRVDLRVAACVLALGVAAGAYHVVENPIRYNSFLVKHPTVSLYLGAAIMASCLTAASSSIRLARSLADTPGIKTIISKVDDSGELPKEQCLTSEQSRVVKACEFGDPSWPANIVLFGDSHARQWFSPLRKITRSQRIRLTTMVKASCPAIDISPADLNIALAKNCDAWRFDAIRRILILHPSAVFIGNATYYLGQKDRPTSRSVSLEDWRNGAKRIFKIFAAAGITVVSMRDNPLPLFDVPVCLERAARHSWYPARICDIVRSESLNPAIFEAQKAAASGLGNIHFIDLTNQFCQGAECAPLRGNVLVYRDDNHLNHPYVDSLMPALESELLPILRRSSRVAQPSRERLHRANAMPIEVVTRLGQGFGGN